MSKVVNANTDITSLMQRLGVGREEELRTSRRREAYLEKYARVMGMDPHIRLGFSQNASTASVRMDKEHPYITIPTKKYDQPETEFPEKVYDLLVQEIMTDHELGHILYSDWPSLEKLQDQLPPEKVTRFHYIWNVIEDGCIEAQIMRDFNNSAEFDVLHKNLCQPHSYGDVGYVDDIVVYDIYRASITALFDWGYYNSHSIDELLDKNNDQYRFAAKDDGELFERKVVPKIKEVLKKAHSEPNAAKRNQIIHDFFIELDDIIENEESVMSYNDPPENGMGLPNDANPGIGEALEDLDLDSDNVEVQPVPATEEFEESDPLSQEDYSSEELSEKYERELESEYKSVEGAESLEKELETIVDMMNKEGGKGTENLSIVIPENHSGRSEIWERGVNEGRRIMTILEDKLLQKKADRTIKNQSRGVFDPRAMIDVERGGIKVFKQTIKGKDPNYSCVLIIDRSGSMSHQIDETEVAVVAYCWALHQLGVDTMVLDFLYGDVRLAKAFGVDPEHARDNLTFGEASGGTPLAHAMKFCKERIHYGAGETPFAIVATDGFAGSMERYLEEVESCQFPVFGIYLEKNISREGDSRSAVSSAEDMTAFERFEIIFNEDSISFSLMKLAYQMIVGPA